MISAAVIGLGRIGAGFQRDPRRVGVVTHAAAWNQHPAARLIGGVDPDPSQRDAFERDFDCRSYESWEALFEVERPQIVSLCTPPSTHASLVLSMASEGIDRILCEKPCTPDLPTIQALVTDLGANSLKVGVNYTRCYDALHRRELGLLRSQTLTAGWGRYGAGLLNTASHWFASLITAGARVARVLATPAVSAHDPSPNVILELDNKGLVFLAAGQVEDFMIFETDLFSSQGRIRLTHTGSLAERSVAVQSPRFSEYRELTRSNAAHPLGLSNVMLAVVDDAIMSLEEGRPMRSTLEEAVRVHELLGAVRRSLASGTWVQL
jgi:predicted dehydrogenase